MKTRLHILAVGVLLTSIGSAPAVVNGQKAVTNPISGTRKLYRLSR